MHSASRPLIEVSFSSSRTASNPAFTLFFSSSVRSIRGMTLSFEPNTSFPAYSSVILFFILMTPSVIIGTFTSMHYHFCWQLTTRSFSWFSVIKLAKPRIQLIELALRGTCRWIILPAWRRSLWMFWLLTRDKRAKIAPEFWEEYAAT